MEDLGEWGTWLWLARALRSNLSLDEQKRRSKLSLVHHKRFGCPKWSTFRFIYCKLGTALPLSLTRFVESKLGVILDIPRIDEKDAI